MSGQNENDNFVDIHGRDLATVRVGQKEEVACFLSDLKQTGVNIYRKSQYVKLATIKKDFDPDFINYMLEAAKSFMLSNKISFTQQQITNSIENCIQTLSDSPQSTPPQKSDNFFKDRVVQEVAKDEICIQVSSTPPPKTKILKTPVLQRKSTSRNMPKKINDFDCRSESSMDLNDKMKKNKRQSEGGTKKFTYNTPPQESTVIVTYIDKSNCCWVRDTANNELFAFIHSKVNNEAKTQKAVSKPWKMETVYMAEDEGAWFRCKLVRFKPLTVFFLDYGNVVEVAEIREVSEEMAKLPSLAVRITFKAAEYSPRLEDEIRIKRFLQNDDGTFFVNILSKNNTAGRKTIPEEPCFFGKPPYFCTREDGQKVVIAYESDSVFYLKTRECRDKLRELESKIIDYVQSAPNIRNVKNNQLVLCKSLNGKFHRAVVTKINGNNIEVEFLDLINRETVEISSLKTISEELSKEPLTYFFGGKLSGFDKPLNEDSKQLIKEHIKMKKIYQVVLGFDDELDLFDGTQLLSEQLQDLNKLSGRVLLRDIKLYKPEFGIQSYLCGCYRNSNDFTLVPSDILEEQMNYVLRREIDDTNPYTPKEGEVCLCWFVDYWYRCLVTRIFEKEFEVLLLDFGNVEVIPKDDLRKADDEITQVPALALPCVLINVPDHPKIESVLKKNVLDGEMYRANIKNISEGKYQVELPSVYKEIKK